MSAPGWLASWPPRLRVGLAALLLLALAAVAGPWLAADPTAVLDPAAARLLPPGASRVVVTRSDGSSVVASAAARSGDGWRITRLGTTEELPAASVAQVGRRFFPLGTDIVGRDVLARLLSGARVSLGVGTLALVVALAVGVSAGVAAGWAGGVVDGVLMRIVDAFLAVPMLFLLLFLAAVFRPSLAWLVAILGFSSWMGVARLVRGQVLSLKSREYVLAARAMGAGPLRIAAAHLIPNALTPLAQDAALRLGDLILIEASLSFLGLGVQPPAASWGNMVAEGQEVLADAWWLTFLPAVLVALTVIGAALAADGLQQLARADERTR
ncbi:MAG TPA: ABC transporter permease [Thermoanaerobaculaceae bacterium]|nr:ABC transporter permease [Thermoanaerobaculaceae bacterium]